MNSEHRSRTPPPGKRSSVLHQVQLSMPNASQCRLRKIADTYGTLTLGNTANAPIRSLYNDQFQGRNVTPPKPIYPRGCLKVDRNSHGDFKSVAQSDYSQPQVQRRRYLGMDKQTDLRSFLPLADSQGTPFQARSEKQDQYLSYRISYKHT